MSNPETKICQNCHHNFTIEPEEFQFYGKIKVPPPTWCPECRLQRRLAFRNERALYKRPCGLCKKEVLTMYGPDSGVPSYCNPCWWSDGWNPLSYGQEYDFKKPFFEQFRELINSVPQQSLSVSYATLINSDYNNMNHQLKNCYWLFNSDYDENCRYGEEVENSRDCNDVTMVDNSELIYGSVNCVRCYKVINSVDCEGCNDVWYSRSLSNCSNCFGCTNLRGKKYHLFNKPHGKDEYEQEVKKLINGSYGEYRKTENKVFDFWSQFPRRFMHGTHNTNASGDYINHSKNVHDSYVVTGAENCRYCMWLIVKPNKDCYDVSQFGDNLQNVYESMTVGGGVQNSIGGIFTLFGIRDASYTIGCWNDSSNLFGCISLRGKKYCVLNKQYSREEYENLVPHIMEHMNSVPYTDKNGRKYRYGDFFPAEISPFGYNETTANEYFPLTEGEAVSLGYKWQAPRERNYQITKLPEDLPDNIEDAEDSLTQEIIGCAHQGKHNEQCTTAFKIIPQELQFYRQMNLPLPRLCPNCRHYQRLKQRNPLKLWHRRCQCAGKQSENGVYVNTIAHQHEEGRCPNEFETSYAPERPEIVYCESCYNSEVA